jgi:hypothetical protein
VRRKRDWLDEWLRWDAVSGLVEGIVDLVMGLLR